MLNFSLKQAFSPLVKHFHAFFSCVSPADIASVEGNSLTISNAGDIKLSLTFEGIGNYEKTYAFSVGDKTPPVIAAEKTVYFADKGETVSAAGIKNGITASDNFSSDIAIDIDSIKFFQSETAHNNGIYTSLSFDNNSLTMSLPGIYVFTVSAADEAGNTAKTELRYYAGGIELDGLSAFDGLKYSVAGEYREIPLPTVATIAEEYSFKVLEGPALIGMGEYSGKLLLTDCGKVRVLVETGISGLQKEFVFTVLDGIVPAVALAFGDKTYQTNYELSKSAIFEAGEMSDNLTETAALVRNITVRFAAAEDGEQSDVVFDGEKIVLSQAGYYFVTLTVTDEAGNSASATAMLKVTAPEKKGYGSFLDGSTFSIFVFLIAAAVLAVIFKRKRV
jgi:hypothetical protein